MTIERTLTRLEEIVERLETEPLELSAALALFEEGVACLREASTTLTDAEARVLKLIEQADGAVATEPLDEDDD